MLLLAYLIVTFIPPGMVMLTIIGLGITGEMLKIWLVIQIYWTLLMLLTAVNDNG